MTQNKIRYRFIPVVVGCLMGVAAVHAKDQPSVQAVWKSQEIRFSYQRTEREFSCDGMMNKLRRVINALGKPGAEVSVEPFNCGRPEEQPVITVKMTTAMEATPEVLATAGGETPFAAVWKPVNLSRGRLGLEEGDCGLIHHVRMLVLPQIDARIVVDGPDCLNASAAGGQPKLRIEVLAPAK